MYLSRMKLNTTRRDTMKALSMPNMLHGAVEAAFTGPRERRLWRIDELGGVRYLLLVSREKPDLSSAVAQFGFADDAEGWQTREYEPLLKRICPGGIWQFRLTANPTISVPAGGEGKRGAVRAHITSEYQKQWLLRRCEAHGFSLCPDDFTVTGSKWYSFGKGGTRREQVSLLAVTYEGLLTVTDADRFCRTLTCGIGREKAYGMGMLTVVKPREV